uniref:Uncharacterized protein n=1 Tax=Trichuris muris TaxID=70415 RepID=A0A5S6QCW4_TRIMR
MSILFSQQPGKSTKIERIYRTTCKGIAALGCLAVRKVNAAWKHASQHCFTSSWKPQSSDVATLCYNPENHNLYSPVAVVDY